MRTYIRFTVVILLCMDVTAWAGSPGPGKHAEIDIDGNGIKDSIDLTITEDTCGYSLKINQLSVTGSIIACEIDGFSVVDVFKSDKYKEIAVHAAGPSDDHEYIIFWYDGKHIHELANITGLPQFNGNGIVYVDSWMGFWTRREKYLLSGKQRSLNKVPQPYYYVGIKTKVKTSFPLYLKPGFSSQGKYPVAKVANLAKGSNIEILIFNPTEHCLSDKHDIWSCQWYLIKSYTGLIGWALLKDIDDNVERLPWAD